jgi:cobalt/nickel transport system permease protein
MLAIDHYAYQSRWRGVSPLLKAAAYLVLLLIALSTGWQVQFPMFVLVAAITCYVSRISWRRYGKWLAIPLMFLLMSMLGIILSFGWQAGDMLASVKVGSLYIGVSEQTLWVAQKTFCRSLACVAVTYLFVLSTPFDQLIIIGQKLRLPKVLIEVMLLTYRFIFIFLEEAAAIYRAQTLRFGHGTLKNRYRSLGMLITMLFMRVFQRYRVLCVVLEVKLYKGGF